jgi:hypothetical protein
MSPITRTRGPVQTPNEWGPRDELRPKPVPPQSSDAQSKKRRRSAKPGKKPNPVTTGLAEGNTEMDDVETKVYACPFSHKRRGVRRLCSEGPWIARRSVSLLMFSI